MQATQAVSIDLTPRQVEIAEWAIDPMEDYWEEQQRDGLVRRIPPLPRLTRRTLVLPLHRGVVADFCYRLEVQIGCDWRDDPGSRGERRAALALAAKIRDAADYREEW